MISDREPRLPPELERHIFEMGSPKDHKSIILVARRAYGWIFPLQFHSLVFDSSADDSNNLENFLDLMQTKPSGYFVPHANKLLLRSDDDVSMEAAPKLLDAFSSLKWLAIWSIEDDPQVFELILGLVELKRLSLCGETSAFFEALRNKSEALPNLTHLDVECGTSDQFPDPIIINRLRSLTHLCCSVHGDFSDESLSIVLNGASSLHVLVIMDLSQCLPEDDSTLFESDFRVLLTGDSIVVGSWSRDWKAHERGEPDFWDRAEAAIASKRPQAN